MEIKHGKLTVKGDLDKLPEGVLDKLLAAFDAAYPKIWARFGDGEEKDIVYGIKADYDGIAFTAGSFIGLNPAWMVKNPNDIDCMTHELIHAAQQYPSYQHAWLVEGIADYGRDVYGVCNDLQGWKLPSPDRCRRWQDGYRACAAFLKYLEKKHCEDIVDKLHLALRNETFDTELFVTYTGKTLEELWDAFKNS